MPPLFVCLCVYPNLIKQKHMYMETKHKELYKSPQVAVLELMEEGVICTSGLNGQLGDPADYPEMPDPFAF